LSIIRVKLTKLVVDISGVSLTSAGHQMSKIQTLPQFLRAFQPDGSDWPKNLPSIKKLERAAFDEGRSAFSEPVHPSRSREVRDGNPSSSADSLLGGAAVVAVGRGMA
jgi:hypothetical protein